MRLGAAIVGVGALAASATAQPAQPREPSSPRSPGQAYEELEQGVEDIGPLGESLETPMLDLRVPTGFERVYRTPDASGNLMRIDGAIHAIFPRSEYIATRLGLLPVVPAGTVFHLGAPRAWEDDGAGARAPGASSLRVDGRLSARLAPESPAPGPPATGADALAPERTTVMSSEAYRRQRMAAILADAMAASEAPASEGAGEDPERPQGG